MKPLRWILLCLALVLVLSSVSAAWNTDYSAWTYRRPITITNNYAGTLQDVNNVSRCVLDTSALIGAGKMQADGGDSRIAKCNTSGTDADFNISSINSTDTNVWLTVPASIGNGATDTDYCVFYGNAAAANYTPSQQPVPGASTAYVDDVMYNGEVSGIWSGGGAAYSSTRVYGSSAISFDGTNEILYPLNASAIETIEFWIYPTNAASAPEVWGVYSDNANRMQLSCTGAGGTWNLYATGIGTINQSAGTCNDNTWYHFKMQFGTGGYKVWINGTLTHSGADTVKPSDATIHVYGCAYWNAACDAGQIQGSAQSFVYRNAAATLWPQFAVDTYTEQPTCALGAEEVQTNGPTSTATVSPNPGFLRFDRGITSATIDFNSSNTPSDGATIIDTNWYVDGVLYSTDENTTRTFTDWQLDINITLLASDQNGVSQTDTNLNIRSYPMDLNTLWTPTVPGKNENADFNSTADSNSAILAYLLENRTDDVNVMDANQVRAFTSTGAKTMRLHVHNADDLNETLDFLVYISGTISTCVYDENRNNPMPWANAYVNGVAQTLDSRACFTYSLGSLSPTVNSTITITADSNAGVFQTRYWVFDLNQTSEPFIDQNILLCDSNCANIEFVIYDTDEATILKNTYIEIWNETDGNAMASRRKTDAAGSVFFRVNANDINQLYRVFTASTINLYYPTAVNVEIPIDEKTLAPVADYNMVVGGLGFQSYPNLTAAKTVQILSNTVDYYLLTIQCGPLADYFSRQYAIRTRGDTETYALQPYCINSGDGVAATFRAKDKITDNSLPDILIVLLKNIPDVGSTLVESTITDITGTAILSYILADSSGYTIQFYSKEGVLYDEGFLRPALASYEVGILTTQTTFQTPTFTTFRPKIVFSPESKSIKFGSATGISGFDVNISGPGTPVITITVSQGATTIDQNLFTSYGWKRFDYNAAALNLNQFLTVNVQVQNADGNTSATQQFYMSTQGFSMVDFTKGLVSGTGELGPGAGVWIVVLAGITIIGGMGAFFVGGLGAGAGVIVVGVIGMGFLLGFVPIYVFIICLMAGVSFTLLTWRK